MTRASLMTLDDIPAKDLPALVAVSEGNVDHGPPDIVPGEPGQEQKRMGVAIEEKLKWTRKKYWTEDEHNHALIYYRLLIITFRCRKTISPLLPNKTDSQIGSHAQKYFQREERRTERKRKRKSINDTVLLEEDRLKLTPLIMERLQALQYS
ncbi:hypothetical protein CRG98_046740 [Punica granatum]|uniref:HTH myb-type domain-containing protein n=1 Tax=Punica granatum TaxID=22663 RepID=A0A2I0HMB2_PUNGR|nr:hypothetical protein CRG98_046740 [Punica granatum]